MAAHPCAAVAGELDEVHRVKDRDRTREVSRKDETRLEGTDEHRLAAGVIARDLRADLPHPSGKLRRREVDLPDPVVHVRGLSWPRLS